MKKIGGKQVGKTFQPDLPFETLVIVVCGFSNEEILTGISGGSYYLESLYGTTIMSFLVKKYLE